MVRRFGKVLLALVALLSAMGVTPSLADDLRADICPAWCTPEKHLRWPANNGFAAAPVAVVLPPGMLIDRFGSPYGRFFSPKGASYSARALPYVCASQAYTVYRVASPVLAWTGTAAPWFGEAGGATQFQTDANVATLLADHTLEVVSDAVGSPCQNP